MINKKNLWFLTLFSLVLVLSIYYVTMPSEMFEKDLVGDTENVSIEESSVVEALKVEDDANSKKEAAGLKQKLTNSKTTMEEKNKVFEELKILNMNSSKEETLQVKIKELCNCDNFVKIEGNEVRVVLDSKDSSVSNANQIMQSVQKEFDKKMYVSVKYN